MTHRDFRASAVRHALGPALLACVALVACSSAPAPPPDAFVALTLGPHLDSMGNNFCSYGTVHPALSIGVAKGGVPATQADNSTQSDGNISVGCSVKSGFDVVLSAALGGTSGGTLQINGQVSASSGGSGIMASFTSNGVSYAEADCTIVFMYEGGAVPTSPPIATGRIWAHLKCPAMLNPSTPKKLADGTQVSEMCDGEADFLFEKCSE
jgi:hypothetical protein